MIQGINGNLKWQYYCLNAVRLLIRPELILKLSTHFKFILSIAPPDKDIKHKHCIALSA